MHPSNTVTPDLRTTFSAVFTITFCALFLSACAPGDIVTERGDGTETGDGDGDPGSDAATDEPSELPTPEADSTSGQEPVGCGALADRADLVAVGCGADDGCSGTWDPCAFESSAVLAVDLASQPTVDPEGLWSCADSVDVDVCVDVDGGGHQGCFWYAGEYAVAVAPQCAVGGLPGWHDVGSGMMARSL